MPSTHPPVPIRTGPPPTTHHDVVVVGGRVAGAATAMLLARRGARVLVLERAAPGSDTHSTHALMRGGVLQLHRWGLLPRVVASGTPAITHTVFRYGEEEVDITIEAADGITALYAPRRTVIDPILVAAAVEAGAEVRHQARVIGVLTDRSDRVRGVEYRVDGVTHRARAELVIGADGLQSSIARHVEAPVIRAGRASSAALTSYVRGAELATDRYQWLNQEGAMGGVIPTNDAHMVFLSVRPERFAAEVRRDTAGAFRRLLHELAPDVARALVGTHTTRVRAWPGHPAQFRQATGPGWALVGDAGCFKDPGGAHGMTDALRDAELLADAVSHGRLESFQQARDDLAVPFFEALEPIIALDWTLETLQSLHLDLARAMSSSARRMIDAFDATPVPAGI